MDTYLEYLIKQKYSAKAVLYTVLLYVTATILSLVITVLAFMHPLVMQFAFAMIVGLFVGVFFIVRRFNIEYEYIVTNDELDVDKIELNQKVDITADALPNNRFEGYVNNININGTSTNGVTTYPVEIVVNNPDGLLPGMNVNAEIVIAEKENVLTVPVSAVMRGNTVYVKGVKTEKTDGKSAGKAAFNPAPDGFGAVKVTTGISDDNNIEITSGLKEGDVVYVRAQATTTTNNMMMPGGMGGMGGMSGMGGGGMPGGGMR